MQLGFATAMVKTFAISDATQYTASSRKIANFWLQLESFTTLGVVIGDAEGAECRCMHESESVRRFALTLVGAAAVPVKKQGIIEYGRTTIQRYWGWPFLQSVIV